MIENKKNRKEGCNIFYELPQKEEMRFKYTPTAKGERKLILISGKVDWYRKKLDAPYE